LKLQTDSKILKAYGAFWRYLKRVTIKTHVEAVSSLSPGPAKVLNAMLASYGIMPTVRK